MHCRICGAGPFTILTNHVRRAHHKSRREYEEMFPGARVMTAEVEAQIKVEMAELRRLRSSPRRLRYCKRGHPLRLENVVVREGGENGRRTCRRCKNAANLVSTYRVRGDTITMEEALARGRSNRRSDLGHRHG